MATFADLNEENTEYSDARVGLPSVEKPVADSSDRLTLKVVMLIALAWLLFFIGWAPYILLCVALVVNVTVGPTNWTEAMMIIYCWFTALFQIRMWLIYSGKAHSAVIGSYAEPHVLFMRLSVRRGIAYGIYGLLFLVFNWPEVLTYVAVVWTLMTLFHPLLFCSGRPNWKLVGLFAFKSIVLGVCVYFLGF